LMSMLNSSLGSLKVTIQKFYRITGVSTQYKGVTPDIIIPDPFGYGENREQDLDYSLPWDEVAGLHYTPWIKQKYNLGELNKKSQERVAKNFKFQQIIKSIDYLKQKSEDTTVSLNLEELQKEDKENKAMIEKLKYDDPNKNLLVTNYEESVSPSEQIKKAEEKQWKEDLKKRNEEWVDGLQKDPILEESLYIIQDMLKQNSTTQSNSLPMDTLAFNILYGRR